MIDWKSLTPDARNQLVAKHIFDWQPEPCPPGAQAVWSNHGLLYLCSMCGAGGETPEQIEHQSINVYPCYSESMDAALLVLNHEAVHEWALNYLTLYQEYTCDIFTSEQCLPDAIMTGVANNPQEAICIAVLRASGMEVQD